VQPFKPEAISMPATSDPFGLVGRVCVVTGAASGIGRGIAHALAQEGARVAVLDRNLAGAEETQALIAAAGGDALAIACDVTSPESIEDAERNVVAKFGAADVLVNNAGMIRAGTLDTLPIAEWNALLSVNLTGYFLCAQAFGRAMRERGSGALIHVSSISATNATAAAGAYSVAKAGVTMLSRQLAVEWGPRGVRSNSVHPGMIYTPLSQAMYDQPGVKERRSAAIPVGRIGTPDDIAQAVVFLAGIRSAYVTGTEVVVDGGFTSNLMSLIPRAGY
jgi:NAD(P)-dependent dehydrogenase (short-subunit alcohol dehydrogenase family)